MDCYALVDGGGGKTTIMLDVEKRRGSIVGMPTQVILRAADAPTFVFREKRVKGLWGGCGGILGGVVRERQYGQPWRAVCISESMDVSA